MTRKKKHIIAEKLAHISKTASIFIKSDDAISNICGDIVDIAYAIGGQKTFEEIFELIK